MTYLNSASFPLRPAWAEINLRHLRRNIRAIMRHKPPALKVLAVVKDEAYGHGALDVACIALEEGVWGLGLSTLEEALLLREAGIRAPLLLLGERQEEELPWCIAHDLTVCVNEPHVVRRLAELALAAGKQVPVHVKINTGMNRYGVRWDAAGPLLEAVLAEKPLRLEGVMSHFAQSDEADKSFARLQLNRFESVLNRIQPSNGSSPIRHLCNSGGFLDLPEAHFDMVRTGILMHGVYPSRVCRRLDGIRPVMSIKARIAAIQHLKRGDKVGYGMHYTARTARRIAVLPIGYGDGFPRRRNEGHVLVHGQRAPLIGGVAMDAVTVDITEIPEARMWDEATIMGADGEEEITVHDIAALKGTVSYEVLTSWRLRLRRQCVNEPTSDLAEGETSPSVVHRTPGQ